MPYTNIGGSRTPTGSFIGGIWFPDETCSECGNDYPADNIRPYKYEKTRKVCEDCEAKLMEAES